MSYELQNIDGDISVGRNAAIGGRVTIQGATHLKSGLKVDGWLEADNIKGAGKGLFATVEELKKAVLNPQLGDWAVIGNSVPGPIYKFNGEKWIDTGTTGGGDEIRLNDYLMAEEITDASSIL